MVAASELPIDTSATAMEMANEIMGDGVTVVSASYTGDNRSSGIFTDGDTVSPGVTPSDTGVMFSTGRLSRFTNSWGDSNHNSNTTSSSNGPNNEAGFNALAGTNTYDASYIDIDFIPTGDTMTLTFVFASEEYPEWTNSIYTDAVGVWSNGTEVELAVGNGDTDPGNINATDTQNLYIDNTGDQYNTEMDGFTVSLTLTIPVNSGVVNTLRIGIADVSDSSYDSTLIIAGNSGQTVVLAQDDETHLDPNGTKILDVLANDSTASGGTLTITHINGQAVFAGDTITLNTGQTVTLNADGTFTLVGDGDIEDFNFTYAVEDSLTAGTDTAFVTVSSVPCFVAGTMIETTSGPVAVENLVPGDMVLTHDNGVQPLRWIGQRTVAAEGAYAPIRIAANTFGQHTDLLVSPQHRILIHDALAELLFEEAEVLVSAKDLVNDSSVRVVEGGDVTYVHILFDAHQVVFSAGLATESFLPGPQTADSFEAEIVEEINALFPELDTDTGRGYPQAARRILKGYEARVLMAEGLAA
ncbi:MAG TPA: Hint domain-containing protein [Aliiroseovarius sp.]|nr:Hint domain-containing protein [Aliiroseovarius sp.]